MIRGPEPLDPRPRPAEDAFPPAREQLPLPRRRQQAHLEPQLRERSGSGDGTPFSAFAAPTATEEQSAGAPPAPGTPSSFSSRLGQALQRGPSAVPDRASGPPAESVDTAGDTTEAPARSERPADRAAAFRAATRRGRRPGRHPRRPRS